MLKSTKKCAGMRRREKEMERYYTIDETADVVRGSHWTVRQWIRLGKLRSVKPAGGKRLIAESDLKSFLDSQAEKIETK